MWNAIIDHALNVVVFLHVSMKLYRVIFKTSLLHSILMKQQIAKSRNIMVAMPLIQPEAQGSLYVGKCIADIMVHFHDFMKKAALNPNFMLALGMDGLNVNQMSIFNHRSGYLSLAHCEQCVWKSS